MNTCVPKGLVPWASKQEATSASPHTKSPTQGGIQDLSLLLESECDSVPPARLPHFRPPHTHRAALLTATGASDTCTRWAGLAVTGKPEGSAPQFPGSDVSARCSPAALPRPCQQVYGKVIFCRFQPQALFSHVPSHFPLIWEYRDPRNGGHHWHFLSPTRPCTSKLPAPPDF